MEHHWGQNLGDLHIVWLSRCRVSHVTFAWVISNMLPIIQVKWYKNIGLRETHRSFDPLGVP